MEGPVPTVPVDQFDYFLFISWVFVIFVSLDYLIRKTNLRVYFFNLVGQVLLILREKFLSKLALEQTQQEIPAIMQPEPAVIQAPQTQPSPPYNYRPRRNLHAHHE
jgi:hypothetical protein